MSSRTYELGAAYLLRIDRVKSQDSRNRFWSPLKATNREWRRDDESGADFIGGNGGSMPRGGRVMGSIKPPTHR